MPANNASDEFSLYDLRVRISEINGNCTCDHVIGDYFELKGGKLSIPDGRFFCLYALQSVAALLPARQRPLHPNDWLETDSRVTCPDPNCGLIMEIERTKRTIFHRSEVSAEPLPQDKQ